MTQKANNVTELLVGKFSALEIAASQPKWLAPVRKAGLASFADQGFPTLHDEDWRFTNVAPIEMCIRDSGCDAAISNAENFPTNNSVTLFAFCVMFRISLIKN